MSQLRYRLDSSWRRPGDGRVVVAGSPLRLFRLSAGGAHVVAQVEAGTQTDTAAVRQLLDRFVEAGALHPLPAPGSGRYTANDVTVVVPAYGEEPNPIPDVPQVVVVDDASPLTPVTPVTAVSSPTSPTSAVSPTSPTAVSHDHVMPSPAIRRLRHDTNRGPGAARNTGLAEVDTALVAFVDTDVRLAEGWLEPLLAHFADPRVALVAPRVASDPDTHSQTASYEVRHSPLDLGIESARISPGTRVSYVPAAVMVCRVDVVRELGGFDETLRFGEDVDLVWRLVAAGHRARYEPESVAFHRPRTSWRTLARQRFGYGRSAAALARRHPGQLAPVRMSGWSAAAWALVAAGHPVAAAATVAGTSVALVRKLADLPPAEAARLALSGHFAAGRQLAQAIRRVWWPIALIAACCSHRARRVVAAAVLAPAVFESARSRTLAPIGDLPAQLLDEGAYGAGVWAGVATEREVGPLLPWFSGWPQRGGG